VSILEQYPKNATAIVICHCHGKAKAVTIEIGTNVLAQEIGGQVGSIENKAKMDREKTDKGREANNREDYSERPDVWGWPIIPRYCRSDRADNEH